MSIKEKTTNFKPHRHYIDVVLAEYFVKNDISDKQVYVVVRNHLQNKEEIVKLVMRLYNIYFKLDISSREQYLELKEILMKYIKKSVKRVLEKKEEEIKKRIIQ